MENDDQEFLNQIEQNILSKDNEQESAREEALQRTREMERIRKASAEMKPPQQKKTPQPSAKNNSEIENDPRYREYFERLRKQKGEAGPSVETPAAGKVSTEAGTDSQKVGPGSIVRFDDGSIGVYKDAVSGRDYALFYFLQPDGEFSPEGVFLQCYQAKAIGILPEKYFAQLRDDDKWSRDMILYHLSSFDHVGLLDNLQEHEERKPKPGTPARNKSIPENPPPQQSQGTDQTASKPAESVKQEVQREPRPTPNPESQQKSSGDGLVQGRKFQINYGGKKWEAVFWSNDSDGAIVAHSTHGHWSLMRLDLDRFKDTMELAEVVDSETMKKINDDVAKSK